MTIYLTIALISLFILFFLNPIIDSLSVTLRRDERAYFWSALFWPITLPYKIGCVMHATGEYFRDLFTFRPFFRKTKKEMAELLEATVRNRENLDKYLKSSSAHSLYTKDSLRHLNTAYTLQVLPDINYESFKKQIVHESYSFELVRCIGLHLRYLPILYKQAKFNAEKHLEAQKENKQIIQNEEEEYERLIS